MNAHTVAQFYSNTPIHPIPPRQKTRISEDDLVWAWAVYSNLDHHTSVRLLAESLGCGITLLRSRFMMQYGYEYQQMARRRCYGSNLFRKISRDD
jgi:hypothetical protein